MASPTSQGRPRVSRPSFPHATSQGRPRVSRVSLKITLTKKIIPFFKTFYREHGEGYFAKGNWSRALSYFERYSIIDPESANIKEKISVCRQKLAAAQQKGRNPDGTAADNQKQNDKRAEIQRLLEESGTESSTIMKYLFEEQEGEKNSDTPW